MKVPFTCPRGVGAGGGRGAGGRRGESLPPARSNVEDHPAMSSPYPPLTPPIPFNSLIVQFDGYECRIRTDGTTVARPTLTQTRRITSPIRSIFLLGLGFLLAINQRKENQSNISNSSNSSNSSDSSSQIKMADSSLRKWRAREKPMSVNKANEPQQPTLSTRAKTRETGVESPGTSATLPT